MNPPNDALLSGLPDQHPGHGGAWQAVLDLETRPVPKFLRETSRYTADRHDISVDRYLAREWHELEKERLWGSVWQMACREEHLPRIGSYVVYEIVDRSYIVVRTAAHQIKAYPNVCLHRGRRLKTYDGTCTELRCPFHGFTWSLDGAHVGLPLDFDFPQLHERSDDFDLPAVQVGTWGGFVFINPDLTAGSLSDFLGVLPDHFESWEFEHRYVQAHVAKVVRCNWKIAMDAFAETLHTSTTHPQAAVYAPDLGAQVDVYGNVARQLLPSAVANTMLNWLPNDDDILKGMLDVRADEPLPISLEAGQTARQAMVAAARRRWQPVLGDRVTSLTDAELVDHFNYTLFPNLQPWGAFNRIVYRFRPNGDNHESCMFEVMYLSPYAGERPPPAERRLLGVDDPWTDVEELGTLAVILMQDDFNLQEVQRGMRNLKSGHISPGVYEESMLRWRHDLLDRWIGERPNDDA